MSSIILNIFGLNLDAMLVSKHRIPFFTIVTTGGQWGCMHAKMLHKLYDHFKHQVYFQIFRGATNENRALNVLFI